MPLPRSESRLSASKAMLDGVAWCVALYVAAWVRLDLHFGLIPKIAVLWFLATAAAGQILIGYVVGLYRMKWMYGSFDEVASLARTALLNTVALVAINSRLHERYVPMSATLAGGVIAFVLMGSSRYGVRLLRERWLRPDPRDPDIVRTLVFGAGEAGAQMIRAMLRDPSSRYVPVGLIDDDPAKRRLSIHGVPVLGTRRDIPTIATSMNASSMLIAAPSVESDVVRELSALAESLDPPLRVKVLPPVNQLLEQHLRVSDIRDVSEEDLLGRHQIRTDIPAIAGYLRGRRVLVTGAGGSIGSELCRQIKLFSPAALIMLDRDESALHAVQLSIEGKALLDSPNLVLADIRDVERLNALFELHRPEVVFHAAALKHLTLLEQNPGEALKSNIWGTLNVLEAAAATGVDRFVNISTDKAANPISVLGYSKRTAERLTAHVARIVPRASYLSVRFGNVLGSRGSVLTAFRSQIESGGPVTVTDRDVTRFFMTIPEAVQLVIQAGAIGNHGEALVLDMGDPVRIADVARQLIAGSKKDIRIVYTGLRPGEKLHEELLGDGEVDYRPTHPLITHTAVPPLHPAEVLNLDPMADGEKLIAQLASLCTYEPSSAAPLE